MKLSRRVVISILFIAIILLFGMFFWQFILNEIITPIAQAGWLLLRLFVLSIDQKYYWGVIIFIVFIFLYRLISRDSITTPSEDFQETNETIETIGQWRTLFTLANDSDYDEITLKRELIHMVASFYASKQGSSTYFIFYDALRRGEIPLPDHIHTFLFPVEQQESRRSFKKLMQFVRETPRKWIRDWTRQRTAQNYRMIDEILSFIETSMEIENGDGKFTPNRN
jgi:hypothetical protein